jgi:hypothetical protein
MHMNIGAFRPRILAFALAAALPAGIAVAADNTNIGVTSAAQNKVDGIMGGQTAPLKVGSPVFQNQHVRTGQASTAQLLFRDQTSLSVGPSSEVVLDKFIYDPSRNSGDVVLSATRGAFRFVSGTQEPKNYQIRTPVATIGVRGTVVDAIVTDHSTSVILAECCADIRLDQCGATPSPDQPREDACLFHLDVVGEGFTIFDDGRVDGPFVFDGSQSDGVGSTTFPLRTTQTAVESHDPLENPATTQGADIIARGDEIAIQQEDCVGPDCGCQDCGPGF